MPAQPAGSSGDPGRAGAGAAGPSRQEDERPEDLAAFECCICLCVAKEPVVTRCGHLMCWPCFWRWMQARPDCKLCPVCKAGTDEASVTPIFGRGREQVDPRKTNPRPYLRREPEADSIPRRPPGQRPPAVDRGAIVVADPVFHGLPTHGALNHLGSIFGLHASSGTQTPLTAEQQSQAFLSKLLLMVGSLVLMALLLF